jgi:hypothetical protein
VTLAFPHWTDLRHKLVAGNPWLTPEGKPELWRAECPLASYSITDEVAAELAVGTKPGGLSPETKWIAFGMTSNTAS